MVGMGIHNVNTETKCRNIRTIISGVPLLSSFGGRKFAMNIKLYLTV